MGISNKLFIRFLHEASQQQRKVPAKELNKKFDTRTHALLLTASTPFTQIQLKQGIRKELNYVSLVFGARGVVLGSKKTDSHCNPEGAACFCFHAGSLTNSKFKPVKTNGART